jgi:tetratricopeptide (TPR) repeat protein
MWLLPLWLLMEIFYGALFGQMSGTAHWAHVGGFIFGALAALGIRYSGLEHKMNKSIEDEISITSASEIAEATELMHQFKTDEALAVLQPYGEQNPNSIDACILLQQAYFRKGDLDSHRKTLAKLCELHLGAREYEAAWQDYEEFLEADGNGLPPAVWFDLCRAAEQIGKPDRAYSELQSLAATYPNEKLSLQAQLSAARIALKKLNRAEDALRHFEAAQKSPIPHLDIESVILAGIRDAKAAMANSGSAAPAPA